MDIDLFLLGKHLGVELFHFICSSKRKQPLPISVISGLPTVGKRRLVSGARLSPLSLVLSPDGMGSLSLLSRTPSLSSADGGGERLIENSRSIKNKNQPKEPARKMISLSGKIKEIAPVPARTRAGLLGRW